MANGNVYCQCPVGDIWPWAGAGCMKRVLIWVAQCGFRDEELFEPMGVLQQAGIRVDVVSHELGKASSKAGATIAVRPMQSVSFSDYDAFLLVGGPGTIPYLDDATLHAAIRTASTACSLVGAICYSPNILARAGILSGRSACVWQPPGVLPGSGCTCVEGPVHADGNIITADGPLAARKWGEAVRDALR